MKRNFLSFFCALFVIGSMNSQETKSNDTKENSVTTNAKLSKRQAKKLQKKHAYHLANNKINDKYFMPKSERKSEGIPPNQYFEQEWLLSMNPSLGRPTPEKLEKIREDVAKERKARLAQRIPGDATDNNWIERGPNNVGGRTRAIIFDTTDPTLNTVIAGGVSGGLWRNTNISSATSTWSRITTFPEHVNVQNITVDPNNANTWYVGTGESYVFGDVNGNGIWKTTDKGVTWSRVFGGGTVTTTVKDP